MSMRVVVANPGSDVYGSDLQVLESVRALVGAGSDVVVLTPAAGPLDARFEDAGARVERVRVPVIRRAYLSPTGMVRLVAEVGRDTPGLLRALRRLRPDVLYVNTITMPWWLLAARAARVPALCHVHEAEDSDPGVVRRLMSAPLLAARRVVFISRTAEHAALEVVPRLRSRAVVVLNGVPDRPVPPVAPPAGARPGLCLVSRLSERKSQHVAIEAVGLLRDRGVDVALELVGTVFPGNEAYEERLVADVVRLGLGDRVTFSGYVSPSWTALDRGDIALHLSVRDALGNVVIEGQLARRPVVATNVGGHLESIVDGETGVLVPPGDAAAVADAVAALVADPDRAARIADAGRASALRLFGTERYAAGIVGVVESLTSAATAR